MLHQVPNVPQPQLTSGGRAVIRSIPMLDIYVIGLCWYVKQHLFFHYNMYHYLQMSMNDAKITILTKFAV